MVNQQGAEAGIEACGNKASLPMLQDGADNPMRTVFSTPYNGVAIVDTANRLVHVIATGVTGDPDALAAAVTELLP